VKSWCRDAACCVSRNKPSLFVNVRYLFVNVRYLVSHPETRHAASLQAVLQEVLELMTKTWNSQSDHLKAAQPRGFAAQKLRSSGA
jgi:hypothetical protein